MKVACSFFRAIRKNTIFRKVVGRGIDRKDIQVDELIELNLPHRLILAFTIYLAFYVAQLASVKPLNEDPKSIQQNIESRECLFRQFRRISLRSYFQRIPKRW
jgi:hypothetical protein